MFRNLEFAVIAQTDLKVYLTPAGSEPDDVADLLVLTTEYTVSGVGAESGGNVTLVTGATLNDVITIERDMPIARSTDFQLAGDFLAATLNNELDRRMGWRVLVLVLRSVGTESGTDVGGG